MAKKDDDSPEQELAPPISLRLPSDLMRRAEKLASQYGIPLAQQLRVLIRLGAEVQGMFPRSLEQTIALLQNIDFEAIDKDRGANSLNLLRSRIGLVLSELDLEVTAPSFFLAAVPIRPSALEIPSLFSSKDSPVVKLLENPPTLRRSGFGLETRATAKIVGGQRRKAILPQDKSLNLWRDGTLIFAADGGPGFLCWGRGALTSEAQGPLRINQLALIESTYLFAELARSIFNKWAEPKPEVLEFHLGLLHMTVNKSPCKLSPGPLKEIDFGTNLHDAPDSGATFNVPWQGTEIDPGSLAFSLVSRVYEWFEITHDEIPYTKKDSSHTAIDVEALRDPRKHFAG